MKGEKQQRGAVWATRTANGVYPFFSLSAVGRRKNSDGVDGERRRRRGALLLQRAKGRTRVITKESRNWCRSEMLFSGVFKPLL